jgi:nucleoside-diphosphate-sugar epimerase
MNAEKPGPVLVTGARGFIGRAVQKLLQRAGYRVVGVDQAAFLEPTSDGAEIEVDITDREHLRSLFQTRAIGGVVHLAAVLPTAARREPARATEVNVGGSLNVLEAARQFGVQRFVFGSSLSVYGTCPADRVISEVDRAAPEDLYGAAKLYVEQLGAAYGQSCAMEFVSLRIGRVVGPGAQSVTSAWRSQIFEFVGAARPEEIHVPYASSERILVVHVEEVARMLVALLEAKHPEHAVYNAVCESVEVGALKQTVESLNANVYVKLGGEAVVGNPTRLDWSRFAGEFGFGVEPVFERMARAAREGGA